MGAGRSWAVLVGLGGAAGCNGRGDTGSCAAPSREIAGRVVDEVGTLGPVPGAELRLTPMEGDGPVLTTKTDGEGRFRLTPADGLYALDAAGMNGCFTEGSTLLEVPGCGIDALELRLTICGG